MPELHTRLPERVADLLRTRIEEDLEPGSRLPSELQLAGELRVSRTSVREALSLLWTEGVVERRWGVGTFVRERRHAVSFAVNEFSTNRDIIREAGHEPSLPYAEFELGDAPEEVRETLGLASGEQAWRVERVFAIDGQPAVLLIDYLPERVNGRTLDPGTLKSVEVDMLGFLDEQAQVRVAESEGSLEAVAASAVEAERLGLPKGSPVVRQRVVNYDLDGNPIIYSVVMNRTDVASLRMSRRTRA